MQGLRRERRISPRRTACWVAFWVLAIGAPALIEAQGYKQAQIIRAEADAEAASTYAEAYGKDPDFYAFYRAMQSYETTFAPGEDRGRSSIILSPDNQYLQEFKGKNR